MNLRRDASRGPNAKARGGRAKERDGRMVRHPSPTGTCTDPFTLPSCSFARPPRAFAFETGARIHSIRATSQGFTLVELLVALAIFAVLAAFAYRGLNAMLESRAALEVESRKWRDVALFVGRIERDLNAVLPRKATGASGTALAAVSSHVETQGAREGLALTRSGSPLQENVLAAPQRVAWRLREGRVERLMWAGVDASPREEPQAIAVLGNVGALAFRFLDPRGGEWRPTWGAPGGTEPLPAAVEVAVTLASGERIVRLVDLARTD
jgi:general secretion pathway protein J